MEFKKLVEQILSEEMTAGGVGSVYGPGVEATATQFSGDNYAPNDARNVLGGVSSGMMTRRGMVGKKKKRKKKARRKK